MAEVAKVSDGTTIFEFRDEQARRMIESLEDRTAYIGVTTTPLTDGSTTKYIVIDGTTVEVRKGNIAIYGSAQFLWTGAKWQKFGDSSTLGLLAYKNSASATYTPQGEVSNTDIDYTPQGEIANNLMPTKENFVKAEYNASEEALILTSSEALTDMEVDSVFTGTEATLQTTSTFTGTEATITAE